MNSKDYIFCIIGHHFEKKIYNLENLSYVLSKVKLHVKKLNKLLVIKNMGNHDKIRFIDKIMNETLVHYMHRFAHWFPMKEIPFIYGKLFKLEIMFNELLETEIFSNSMTESFLGVLNKDFKSYLKDEIKTSYYNQEIDYLARNKVTKVFLIQVYLLNSIEKVIGFLLNFENPIVINGLIEEFILVRLIKKTFGILKSKINEDYNNMVENKIYLCNTYFSFLENLNEFKKGTFYEKLIPEKIFYGEIKRGMKEINELIKDDKPSQKEAYYGMFFQELKKLIL